MYVLTSSKSAVPSIGESILHGQIFRNVSVKAASSLKASHTHKPPVQKWFSSSVQPYGAFNSFGILGQTKYALSGFSSLRNKCLTSFTQVRNFVQSTRQDQMKGQDKGDAQKPLPRLLYIQNPIVWFTNKLGFLHLRFLIDPLFTEEEFVRGARQAVSRVTQLLSLNMFDSMKPLFTKSALLNLRRDVEILWSDELRRNIAMDPHDIQLIIPRKLHFRNNSEKRLCDIDVVFIGLKHLEKKENSPILFLDIISRFHRNYSYGAVPEWSIAAFRVRKYNIMPIKAS